MTALVLLCGVQSTTSGALASDAPPFNINGMVVGMPDNVILLSAKVTSETKPVPPGQIYVWFAQKVEGSYARWTWRKSGPFFLSPSTRYKLVFTGTVSVQKDASQKQPLKKNKEALITIQNLTQRTHGFLVETSETKAAQSSRNKDIPGNWQFQDGTCATFLAGGTVKIKGQSTTGKWSIKGSTVSIEWSDGMRDKLGLNSVGGQMFGLRTNRNSPGLEVYSHAIKE